MLRRERTLLALANMLCACHAHIGAAAVEAGACALSLACDTEDFATYRDKHVPPDARICFADMRQAFLLALCEDYDMKRKLRALLDFTSFCERSARK